MATSGSDGTAIRQAIAALEAQRAVLGDEVVDLAIAPLHAQLTDGATSDATGRTLKQATMLFVDLVGSTAMASRLDPEDAGDIIDTTLRRFTDIVGDHRGKVFNYTGDGLVAVFGAGQASEQDAEFAVRAALAIIDDADRHADRIAAEYTVVGPAVRTGVSTGPVALGGGVEDDTSLRGSAVNVAARMEQAAPVGGLRISHSTYRLVRGIFDVTEEPPITVKGITEPVRTYVVHRAKPVAFRMATRGIDGIEAPMVGRGEELALLQRSFMATHTERGLRMAAIVAEPGIGKSRLLLEFDRWSELAPEEYVVFCGRAHPRTRGQPFGLLRDLFAWRFRLRDNETAADGRQRFTDTVMPLLAGDEAAVHLLGHALGHDYGTSEHVAGIVDDPQQIRARAFAAAAAIFRHFADDGPVVALVEDLHWSDDETLDFIEYLHRRHADIAMLIVATSRPLLDERRPAWLDSLHAVRIALDPLRPEDATQLAKSLLARVDEIPPELLDALLARTDGNPFFMEAIVEMLLDEGALVEVDEIDEVDDQHPDGVEPGRWRIVAERLTSVTIPATLTGVLQTRLDALAEPHRRALQQASVIGFHFWDQALRAIDEQSLIALEPLARRGLVYPEHDSRVAGAIEFSFEHHLLQQFTYDTTRKADRRGFHAHAADWLAQHAAEGGVDLLAATAEHFELAGDTATALGFYVRAAERAAARGARTAVLDSVASALTLAEPNDHHVRWRLHAAREATLRLGSERLVHDLDLDELAALAESLDDDERRAESALRRSTALLDRGDHRDGELAGERAIEYATRVGADRVAVLAMKELARAARRTDRAAEALELAERSLEIARTLDDPRVLTIALAETASTNAANGRNAVHLGLSTEALALARRIGDRTLEAEMLNSVAVSLFANGEVDPARIRWEQSVTLSQAIDWTYGETLALLNLAGLATVFGHHDESVARADRAIALAHQSGWRDLEAVALLYRGVALSRLGDFAAARDTLVRARDLFIDNDSPHYSMDPTSALAYLDLVEGDHDAARRKVDQIIAYFAEAGTLAGVEEPARVRLECYLVLEHLGDDRCDSWLDGAVAELQLLVDGIDDPAERDNVLRVNPYQATLLDLWEARCSE